MITFFVHFFLYFFKYNVICSLPDKKRFIIRKRVFQIEMEFEIFKGFLRKR